MGIWSVLIESDVFQSGQLRAAGHFCPSANCGATPAPAGDLSPQCPRNVPASRSSDPTSPPVPPSSPVCHHLFGDHLAATRLMGDTVSPLCADGRLLPNVILITARAPSCLIALLCPGDTVPARSRVLRWSMVDGFICSATRVRSLLITPSSVGLR